MVRKFSFKITPLKVTSSSTSPAVEAPPVIEFMETPSPPFEPASPLYAPPDTLSPSVELELRCACAIILRALKPSGQIYDDLAKQEYSEAQALRRAQTQPRIEPKRQKIRVRPTRGPEPESYRPKPPQLSRTASGPAFRHLPQHAGAAFAVTTESRFNGQGHRRGSSGDDIQSSFAQQLEGRLNKVAAQQEQLPNTGRDSTDLPHDFSNSATMTSHTPVTAAPLSDIHPAFRPSLDALRPTNTAVSDGYSSQRPNTNAGEEISRPPSRRNRIAEYIRPTSSQGSIRSVRTTRSAESNSNGNAWWRPLLSSRKSSGSLRRTSEEASREREEIVNRVNLNRALPPLPSLSNWDLGRKASEAEDTKPAASKEDRPHISQLLKRKSTATLSRPQTAPQTAQSRPTTLAPTIDPPKLPALQFGTLDSGSTSPKTHLSATSPQPQQPLATLDPNASAPLSRVQTRTKEKWRGRQVRDTSVPVTERTSRERSLLEEKAAAHQLSASPATGRLGRLKKQFSRFALGSGNTTAMESGRVGF
ncbi:MAG: hypothetical protein M1814_001907 [Vezdaea aestivalis]|nr:MAG: hypothetical protein M1814_001907 [Vezdaea aestivalis]